MKICTNCSGRGSLCKHNRNGACTRTFPRAPQNALVRLNGGLMTKAEYNAAIDALDILDFSREKRIYKIDEMIFATDAEAAIVIARSLGML